MGSGRSPQQVFLAALDNTHCTRFKAASECKRLVHRTGKPRLKLILARQKNRHPLVIDRARQGSGGARDTISLTHQFIILSVQFLKFILLLMLSCDAATNVIDAEAFRAELHRHQGSGWGWQLRVPVENRKCVTLASILCRARIATSFDDGCSVVPSASYPSPKFRFPRSEAGA